MDKRYQVFVSSTYVDLKEERQKVIQTIMEADCIPSGMELFPAADEEQFIFIKKIIDDCDYYLLIIGGRYGSTTADGISFTEKEYDYAIEKGLKVIAFLHSDPDSLVDGKLETDPDRRMRLDAFREKVSGGRLVKAWTSHNDLPGLVALSLQKTIKMFPATGWIRADQATSVETLKELNELRKEKEKLETALNDLRASITPDTDNLASIDDEVIVKVTYTFRPSSSSQAAKGSLGKGNNLARTFSIV